MSELAIFIPIETLPAPMPAAPAELLAAIADRADELEAKSKAANTREAYASDWRQFTAWCLFTGAQSLPAAPDAVRAYLSSLTLAKTPNGAPYATATIARRLASIAHFHREAGLADPTTDERVKRTMAGIRRDQAGRPTRAKAALMTKSLKKGLRGEPVKLNDHRNRALLLVGFAGAFRRSELVGIDVEHLMFDEEGRARITLPKSKTNQTGELESVWLLPAGEHCPVRSLRKWLEVSGITSGAVFRGVDRHGNAGERLSTDAVAYLVKRTAKRAGLDPKAFSAHSLRSGHVTQAIQNDIPLAHIQRQTRHKSLDMVLRYFRDSEAQTRNSSAGLGL